jgi:hypothetical protein
VPGLRRLGRSALAGLVRLAAPKNGPYPAGEEETVKTEKTGLEAERPHADDLGLDCLAIERWARHAGHAALRPDLPLRFGATLFATMR